MKSKVKLPTELPDLAALTSIDSVFNFVDAINDSKAFYLDNGFLNSAKYAPSPVSSDELVLREKGTVQPGALLYDVNHREFTPKNMSKSDIENGKSPSVTLSKTYMYVTTNLDVYECQITINFLLPWTYVYERTVLRNHATSENYYMSPYDLLSYDNLPPSLKLTGISCKPWRLVKNVDPDRIQLQTDATLEALLKNANPYALKYCAGKNVPLALYMQAPYLEILSKAGYAFVDRFVMNWAQTRHERYYLGRVQCLNRLCQRGSSPKEIFKTSKAVYSALKNETSLEQWDEFRKLAKTSDISENALQTIMGWSVRNVFDRYNNRSYLKPAETVRTIRSALRCTYEDKPVFTFETLVNYLARLDRAEAISRAEALPLLQDYLRMCNQLNMRPKIDGDSLKREHDIAARLCIDQRDEILNREMLKVAQQNAVFNYSESEYFVRAITDQNDLISEAVQQHNCVAGYASSIAAGTSRVFVLRKTAEPDTSLVTVELSPNGRSIRQKYMAFNHEIRDKSISDFLDRWMKHNTTIKLKETD